MVTNPTGNATTSIVITGLPACEARVIIANPALSIWTRLKTFGVP